LAKLNAYAEATGRELKLGTREAVRRGTETRPRATTERSIRSAEAGRHGKSSTSTNRVAAAKANLVRAAFKAGVKPTAIARQFGLSHAIVRELLK
jgi:DNA invertase Pin-like site-specific DNA recombinase